MTCAELLGGSRVKLLDQLLQRAGARPEDAPLPLPDKEIQLPIGKQSPEDDRPEMQRNDVLQWSMTLVGKVDESIALLANQYITRPEDMLALYANVGMYCMGIAESIHKSLTEQDGHHCEPDGRPDEPANSRHWDPNRGYL